MSNDIIEKLMRNAIGYDPVFRYTSTIHSEKYPPYNIEQFGDDHYRLTLAVAGFSKDDITIAVDDGILTVSGRHPIDEEKNFLYRGIASRDFERSFKLGEYVEVVNASMDNGLIVIDLERVVPEAHKPKLIPIK